MTRVLLGLVLAQTVACSLSPSAQSPPPAPASVAGHYTGTWQATSDPAPLAYVMDLQQSDATVTGTWHTSQEYGTVTGLTTATTFSGSMTWNRHDPCGTSCTGAFAVSGNAGGKTVTWTSTGRQQRPGATLPASITIIAQMR